MNGFYKGVILLLISALGYSLLPIFALYAYAGNINVTTLLFIRFLLTAAGLFIYILVKAKWIKPDIKDLLALFVLGAICYNLQSRLYFSSVKYIPASLAALFLYTHPMIVTVLSFLINKERITGKIVASVSISFAGLVMILGTSIGVINGIGILLAIGAAVVYSVYIILGNRIVKRTPPLVTSAFIALFSSAGILVSGLFADGINMNFTMTTWFPIAGLVLFSTVLAMLSFFNGIEKLGPTKASIICMTEPVFTVIFSTILLHDRPAMLQLAGGAVVLAGALLVIRSREQK